MSKVPTNSNTAKFSEADHYAYMQAILSAERDSMSAQKGQPTAARIKKIEHAMGQIDVVAEKKLGTNFDAYYAIRDDANHIINRNVAALAKSNPQAFEALVAEAEKRNIQTLTPLLAAHFSGNVAVAPTAARKPAENKLYEQMGLDATGKPAQAIEVTQAELTAVNKPAKITDPVALNAAREAEKAQTSAAHAGEVSRTAKIEAENLAKEMATHSKSALREATHALAKLTEIHILQNRARDTVDVMKAEGRENQQMLDMMRTQTIAQLEFKKQEILSQIKQSTPEVQKAYAFLSKKFPVEKMASTVFAEHGRQYEKLIQMGEHSGMVSLVVGVISMALLSIHPKQKAQILNADGTMSPPEPNKMGICLKVAGVACAVLGMGMAFGGKEIFNRTAAANLLSKLEKAGTAVKV